jgi:hypothetical protein
VADRLTVRVETRLRDLDLPVWEYLTSRATLFMRRPFLQAIEDAQPETVEPRYALLFDGKDPVAALAGQLLTIHVDRAAPGGEPDGVLAKLARAALEHVDIDVALWGNFLTWGQCGVAFAPGIDEAGFWPRVAEAISRVRDEEAGIRAADVYLVLDVPPHQADGAKSLEDHGFDEFTSEPDMALELSPSWRSFDDYLAALRTKYRSALKDMDEELAGAGCRVERLDDVAGHADELFSLYHQVHERSPHRFVTLKPESIPAFARRLGDDFICNVVRRGDRLLGFGTTLIDGDTAVAYFVGHDVEENRELPVYLRLLQVSIADGIEHWCRRVTYGRTALEPKARLGAEAVPLVVYGRHRNELVLLLISRLLEIIAPPEDPPARRPFRKGRRERRFI